MNGNAIKDAAAQVKQKLIDIARMKLGENIAYDFVARDKRVFLELRPERGVSYYDLVKDAIRHNDGVPLTGTGHYTPHNKGMISPAYAMGIMAIKAKVDRDRARHRAGCLVVHDSGQIINPGARGRRKVAFTWGSGTACAVPMDRGCCQPRFVDYKIPGPRHAGDRNHACPHLRAERVPAKNGRSDDRAGCAVWPARSTRPAVEFSATS